jgi:hypothetical protein
MNKLQFKIEQIALVTPQSHLAKELLADLGLDVWYNDTVLAKGVVFGKPGSNEANLSFNYQAGNGVDDKASKPLELEILNYTSGANWMDRHGPSVSHLGMHVSADELEKFRDYFFSKNIGIAQSVMTQSHTNPAISGKRRYNYVIFDTRSILGVDLKFIVRIDIPQATPDTSAKQE